MRLRAGISFALLIGVLGLLTACGNDDDYDPELSDNDRSGALSLNTEDDESGSRQARQDADGDDDEPEDILDNDNIEGFESSDPDSDDPLSETVASGSQNRSGGALEFKFEEGQRLQYLVSTETESDSPMAQQMPANMGDTEYTINIAVSEAQSDQATVNIDFEANEDEAAGQMMESMEMIATYDRYGNLISSSATMDGEPMEDGAGMGAMGSMGAMQLGFLGLQFPERQLTPGDSWEVEVDISETMREAMGGGPMMGDIEIDGGDMPVNYTLKTITTRGGRRVAEIEYESEGDVEMVIDLSGMGGNQPQNQQMPSEIRMQMNMSSEGVILFDVLRGKIISNEGDSVVDIDSQMFQMEQNIATSMRLVE